MNWDDLRIVSMAAGAQTLTAAAKSLRISVATVSRRLDAFEAETGLRLFDRTANGIKLTPHGKALLSRCEVACQSIESLDRQIAQLRLGIWPETIRVSATEPIIAEMLAPALPRLLAAAPAIRIDLVVSADIVSLATREAEIAIRLAKPTGNSLVARRLPSLEMGLFASKKLLGERRAGSRGQLPVLSYDDSYGPIAEVSWLAANGLAQNVVARMSSTRALHMAAEAGAGVAILPCRTATASPRLVRLHDYGPIPDRQAWMVTHRDLAKVKPLRLVKKWIVSAFEQHDLQR